MSTCATLRARFCPQPTTHRASDRSPRRTEPSGACPVLRALAVWCSRSRDGGGGLGVLSGSPGCRLLSDADEESPGRSAPVQLVERGGGLLQREDRADRGIDLTGPHERRELAPLSAGVCRLGPPDLFRGSAQLRGVGQRGSV